MAELKPQGIFWIRLEERRPVNKTDKEFEESMGNLIDGRVIEVAIWLQRKMSVMLERGGKYNIGATGDASKNILVEPGLYSGYGVRKSYNVIEGTKTPANKAIREGISPGRWASMEELKTWQASKPKFKLYFQPPGKETLTGGYQKIAPYQRKSGPVRGYIKAESGRKLSNEAALYRIRTRLYKSGTFHPRSNWYTHSPYPTNTGRFDYVMYTLKYRDEIMNQMEKASRDAVVGFIRYLSSGRQAGKPRKYILRR